MMAVVAATIVVGTKVTVALVAAISLRTTKNSSLVAVRESLSLCYSYVPLCALGPSKQ